MALLKCPDCGHQVSSKARSCPQCGFIPKPKKQPTVSRTGLRVLLFVGTVIIVAVAFSPKPSPKNPQAEATNAAEKSARDAACSQDIKCAGDRYEAAATSACIPYVERLAKNNFEWIDAWYQPKFGRFRWADTQKHVITYIGDKIKFQNGFGGWVLSIYECEYDLATGTVVNVRAGPGRLEPLKSP